MTSYDHAMIGATLAVAIGARRRHGWPIVAMAAVAAMLPDWDDLSMLFGPAVRRQVHRVWGHNLLVALPAGALFAAICYLCWRAARGGRVPPPFPARLERADLDRPAPGAWMAVGVLACVSHLLADVIYSGDRNGAPWPVAFLWPFSRQGVALPVLSTGDRVATVLLAVGLAVACCWSCCARLTAGLTLIAVAGYAGGRAVLTAGWGQYR
jgi:membrane-bound metal-dependent hydrolase YbcI (DUF457 family)